MVKGKTGKERRILLGNRSSLCDDAIVCHVVVKPFLVSQTVSRL